MRKRVTRESAITIERNILSALRRAISSIAMSDKIRTRPKNAAKSVHFPIKFAGMAARNFAGRRENDARVITPVWKRNTMIKEMRSAEYK